MRETVAERQQKRNGNKMAITQKTAKQTDTTSIDTTTTVDPITAEQGDEMTRMKADRAALDAKIKEAAATQRAANVAKKAATVKTLDQIVAQQDSEGIALWMASTLVARVGQRTRAGQDFDVAAEAVFAEFRQFVASELDRRAREASEKRTQQ